MKTCPTCNAARFCPCCGVSLWTHVPGSMPPMQPMSGDGDPTHYMPVNMVQQFSGQGTVSTMSPMGQMNQMGQMMPVCMVPANMMNMMQMQGGNGGWPMLPEEGM